MAVLGTHRSTADIGAFLREARAAVDAYLVRVGADAERALGGDVGRAVAYALGTPGKRLRPALLLAAYQDLGGTGDATPLAAAVEIVHTYSLVHDDLPCMDDDDLRRGRPTVHRAFDAPTATLAGFRMVPLAARVLAEGAAALGLPSERLRAIACTLLDAAGATGMIGGQVLDLEGEGKALDLAALTAIHRAKTGALITASAVMGALAAGADEAAMAAVRGYGEAVGLAFQIVDDVLDATATSAELGKTPGKDALQDKATFAKLLGLDGARTAAEREMERAIAQLGSGGVDSTVLRGIAEFIVTRRS
jgi:geranylgeranyl pyrophosphate synthase